MATARAELIETHRHGAEVYHGDICKEKLEKFMEEFLLPKGLLRISEIEEFGINRATGFIWIRSKKKQEHKFKRVGSTVIYGVEITGFVERGHMSKVTGIKGKELLVTVGISDIRVGDPSPDMIKFTTPLGLARSNPISAYELEDGEK